MTISIIVKDTCVFQLVRFRVLVGFMVEPSLRFLLTDVYWKKRKPKPDWGLRLSY